MRQTREAEFTAYVQGQIDWLRKTAYLLCQDWQNADDLVQTAITRLYTHWGRARKADSLNAYTRKILVNAFMDERRSSWARRVTLPGTDPERENTPVAPKLDPDMTMDIRNALNRLPTRQRATIVLRYCCDCPVEETAQILGVTPGTVKSQTAKGLLALRSVLTPVMET